MPSDVIVKQRVRAFKVKRAEGSEMQKSLKSMQFGTHGSHATVSHAVSNYGTVLRTAMSWISPLDRFGAQDCVPPFLGEGACASNSTPFFKPPKY